MQATAAQYREAGIYALNHGETDVAVACFEAALRIGTKSAAIYNNLGVARTERGDLEQARTAFREALHREPSQAWVWANYGRLLIRTKEWRSAASAFSKALELDKENLTYAMSEAWCWLQEGKAEAAMEILLGFSAQESENPDFLTLLVEAGIKAGNEGRLYTWLKEANWSYLTTDLRLYFATLTIRMGEPEQAQLLLEDLPDTSLKLYLEGITKVLTEDPHTAKNFWSEKKEELSEKHLYGLAALVSKGRSEGLKSFLFWEKLAKIYPTVRNRIGFIRAKYHSLTNDEGIGKLNELLEEFPDHPDVLWELARRYKGNNKQHLIMLDRLLFHQPWHRYARMERGYLHLESGRVALAIPDFEWLVRKFPDSYDALLGLALSHDQAGYDKRSLAAFRRMAEQFPDRPQVWWNLASATAAANNWQQTLEAVTNFLSFDPEDARAISLKGRALFKLGRTKEAGEVWRGES